MPGLTKRIQKIIDMEGGTKEAEANKPITTEDSEVKVDDNKKNLDESMPKLLKSLPKGVVMEIFPKLVGTYMKAVNHWIENKQGVLGINFSDPNANVSEQAPRMAQALLKEARGWVKTVNDPDFEEAVTIVTELVRTLLKEEISPLLDDFTEVAMPKIQVLIDKNLDTLEKKGAKMARTAGDIVNDAGETALPPLKAVNAASNVIANMLTAIDVGGKVGLTTLEQWADAQQEMMGKQSGGPLMSAIRSYKKFKKAKEDISEKIHNLAAKLESGQMTGQVPGSQLPQQLPQQIPQQLPQQLPQQIPQQLPQQLQQGGRKKTKKRRKRRKRKTKKRTKKRALKKRH